MASGLLGVDSSIPVTSQVQGQGLIQLATTQLNATPAFWGRYFSSPQTKSAAEYHHGLEGGPLNAAGIPVLPVARQTRNVNGSAQQGAADAAANAADLLASFGVPAMAAQGSVFFLFLDVEGSPSLSVDYYTAWAQALTQSSSTAGLGPGGVVVDGKTGAALDIEKQEEDAALGGVAGPESRRGVGASAAASAAPVGGAVDVASLAGDGQHGNARGSELAASTRGGARRARVWGWRSSSPEQGASEIRS